MTKLNSLLNYLIKNSFYQEANYLFKLANDQSPEDYLQENYPNIYAVSLNDSKPAAAYINIINQLRNKGYSDEEIKGFQVNNFQELIKKLKEEKADPKKEFLDEVTKEFEVNISDEELLYAKEKGLTPKETIFLVKDKTAHPFSAKVDWAFKFNQNKHKHEDLRDKKITDYQNIDEVDKALSDKITYSAEYMKDFYEGIKSKAEETSEVIYNSLNYVVSHSKSKEAAQWWEQSCVSYNSRTKTVDAGLCTAAHEDNLYHAHYSDGYLIQIITKSSPSSSTSPKTNFKDKNYSWNLISLHILDNGELSEEHGSTVNRLNQDVTPCEIKDALGDEYNEIIKAISDYFNKNFNTQISGFNCEEEEEAPNILKLIKKDELNERDIQFLKDLSSEDYFNYKLDIKFKGPYPEIFDKNYRYIGSIRPLIYFENNLGKYRNENPEYFELFENALNKINSEDYFELKLDEKYKKDYLNIFERNLNEINSEDYFHYKLDEKYKDQEYFEIFKSNINTISAYNYFNLKLDEKYKSKEYFEILKKNLKRIDAKKYFEFKLGEKYAENYPFIHILKHTLREYFEKKFDEKYPEGLPKPDDGGSKFYDYPDNALIPIKDLLKKLFPNDYFELKLDERYKEYTDILEKNLKEIGENSFFEYGLDEKYRNENPEYFKIFEENLNNISSENYFNLKLDERYKKEYLKVFEENLNDVSAYDYFRLKLDQKYKDENQEYFAIFKSKLKDISSYGYFKLKLDERYREKYPDIYNKNMVKKLSDIPEETYFHKKFDEEYGEKYPGVLSIQLERIDKGTYFGPDRLDLKYGEKYPDIFYKKLEKVDVSIVQNYLLSYLKEYNKAEYPNMFQEIFHFIIYKLREPRKDLLNKFKEIYQDKNAFKIILTNLEPSYYFYNNFDEEYKEYTDVFEKKIKMISAHNYFKLELDEKYKEYTDILEKNKEYLHYRYYSKYIEKNRRVRRRIAETYYYYNIDKFFEKYYPELSEKINNKFKEQIEND